MSGDKQLQYLRSLSSVLESCPRFLGSLSDWDFYYIDKFPGCNKNEAHHALSFELSILLKKLPSGGCCYSRANALKKALEATRVVARSGKHVIVWAFWADYSITLITIPQIFVMERASHKLRITGYFRSTQNQKHYHTRRNWTSRRADIRKIKKHKASSKESEIPLTSFSNNNKEDYNKQENDVIASDLDDKMTESMVGKVERTALIVENVDLVETFEYYCNECEKNIFDLCNSDIMDLRPTSRFTEKIPEEIWEKFVSNTYPEYEISNTWEDLIRDIFEPKETLAEWLEAWRGLHVTSDKKKSNEDLVIKDAIYNILAPYIEAFQAPYNILKSGDLGENQYNAHFVSPVLSNTLKVVLNIEWRILEVPVESSKQRRNANINPIIDKVLEAKRADGLARHWQSHEEVFIYEQTGPPNFDDVTQLFIHNYKLVRTMRDVLNQRIILRLRDGISDHKDLASFGAFGHRSEISLFWCMMHQKSYCFQEYGSFNIPAIWQDLPVLAEAIITCLKFFSFMKKNIEKGKSYGDQKIKLFAKRKVHTVKQNPPSPNRPKKHKQIY
ncbi:13406_t:CDS:10 [Funneliformis mosseae]|uniref:13406_t:CDS:1 n=1 Tax=Funneliformis mosseae TaxID=27381 RepID=A0A9N9BMU6_FUNMO|nr:13406_t:CDS:10 [Funneliformis mosseae]